MEISTDSSSGSQQPQLPPGFRFHPTDEELVVHYLKKKASSAPLPVAIIAEIDLYKFDPWELPGKASFGDQEWYFFSPRDRKYPNGARPNRAATSGYWKATGTDKPILTSGGTQKIGVKKALVFYGGKPPKGIKTNWIMHEYRLIGNSSSTSSSRPPPPGSINNTSSNKNSLRLDDWVLCRIYKKHNSQRAMEQEKEDSVLGMHASSVLPISSSTTNSRRQNLELQMPKSTNCDLLLENNENFFEGLLTDGMNSTTTLSQLGSCSKPGLSRVPATTTTTPLKRTLQSPYWSTIEEGNVNNTASSKKFQANPNSSSSSGSGSGAINGSNSSVAAFLNQLPQAPSSFHQHVLNLGSLGDHGTVLRQSYPISGINWGS